MSVHSLRLRRRKQKEDSRRINPPSHRHAAPSAPWPWVDIQDVVDPAQLASPLPPVPPLCSHETCKGCWNLYPQSLYPNWTPAQVKKSKINKAITDYRHNVPCIIHQVDVDHNGLFKVPEPGKIRSGDDCLDETWEALINSNIPHDNRVRCLFIENLSGPVLQMLGTRYNVEPFFFSSSLNWIPSRYQEEVRPGQGDHITITLTFLRSVANDETSRLSATSPYGMASSATLGNHDGRASKKLSLQLAHQIIDTQAPLVLESNERLLLLDLLSVHLIRRKQGSTIISYHPNKDLPTTTAPVLHERIRFAGKCTSPVYVLSNLQLILLNSVYWQNIFQQLPDPTFVLLTFIWHAMYAWDEALENLYSHICTLESQVITTSEMILTQELHIIRAHLLHYSSLLDDFRKSVIFIRDTENPALESLSLEEREENSSIMKRECSNLLTEIERLEKGRQMQDRRLKNVMDLVFSSVNIIDSKLMQKMTQAAVRDSAAMKQIAYLTMVFLPASFVAAVFGMNVEEIAPGTNGTLAHYAETALPFTLLSAWIIIAFQSRYIFPPHVTFWKRLAWPILLLARYLGKGPFNERGYPQSHFQTWTARQVTKSKIMSAIREHSKHSPCFCHQVDVEADDFFTNPNNCEAWATWNHLIHEKFGIPLMLSNAAYTVHHSGPMNSEFVHFSLRISGGPCCRCNIEPIVWSSSLNWISSRFWGEIQPNIGDPFNLITLLLHIFYHELKSRNVTITHTFSLKAKAPRTLLGCLPCKYVHHMYYTSLLDDYAKHVTFISDTSSPAMDGKTKEGREFSKAIMAREYVNLLGETKRLESEIYMQQRRDPRESQLILFSDEANRVYDHFFLPASFLAGILGVNEINAGTAATIVIYATITLPLTVLTIWVVVADRSTDLYPPNTSFLRRLSWPVQRLDPKDDKGRVPHPSHRHASPSAPWPWVDLGDEVDPEQLECPLPPIPELCNHINCGGCWRGYPQSRFPNWTARQVIKSKIMGAIKDYSKDSPCVCHQVDVDADGFFTNPGQIVAKHGEEDAIWNRLINETRPNGLRVRALFLENLSGPMLQMLGAKYVRFGTVAEFHANTSSLSTRYNIEPFFWSSSLNWIPSRFQEEVQPGIGDHITVTLTFLRSMSNHDAIQLSHALGKSTESLKTKAQGTLLGTQKIDPHSPLLLHSNNRLLVLDLLAVHLIRNVNGSTILSFHPTLNLPTTTAAFLHERIRFAGQSVYWQSIFQKSSDPTFVLLTFIWHAMYAWDEALENLYDHICTLESRVITTEDMPLTRELHIIRAHHLHYASLLDDYAKHVVFIRDTHNPALDKKPEEDREFSKTIMARECANLLTEIKRLNSELHMQERRLKNVMGLVFSSVNINDSRYMRVMTEAAVRDSAVAYLTMVFLPASFVAGVFGMNVSEINPGSLGTLARYIEIALPLTVVTAWIIIAFQSTYIFPEKTSFFMRLGWPILMIKRMMERRQQQQDDKGRVPAPSHRHASPSAPWPWVDLEDEVDREQLESPLPPIPPLCDHIDCSGCWRGYPQSRFPNWTKRQVTKSKIMGAIKNYSRNSPCICYQVDVDIDGFFTNPGHIVARYGDEDATWTSLINEKVGTNPALIIRPDKLRVRALFIENISGPMLQMLGAKLYSVIPFLTKILSGHKIQCRTLLLVFRYELDSVAVSRGDRTRYWGPFSSSHDLDITITLTFLRSMSNQETLAFGKSTDTLRPSGTLLGTQRIDPHSPLMLHSNNKLLVLDLLAVHLIRNINGSTILSFHPTLNLPTTSAAFLHERIRYAGQNVYWQSIFQRSADSTFVLLAFVWHAMYGWDEALENLYDHICTMVSHATFDVAVLIVPQESRVITTTEDMPLTHELHVIRAHHLHYTSLLDDYAKHVIFIRDTPSPAMDGKTEDEREFSKAIMARECANLLVEIKRLEGELYMQERRLQNVLELVDRRYTRLITEATIRDSADEANRLYDYGIFGMNVREINPGTTGTFAIYAGITLPLTALTVWVVIAFQSTDLYPPNTSFLRRLSWPVKRLRGRDHNKYFTSTALDVDTHSSISAGYTC
ncbi:LOW QUALITY PROTEIN: hypothetical protein CVT25_010361 [Psilocybe cyanescens]|uniref:Uncharacterized protein n=1 Tax=Psilocybe cyanescens TaxID=93625 RepID=A0A409XP46_PSICY|nr:LOW QUALITY PROTEIN: hypothetical protein CVT25_010361 [Psilocybe cyanescens]